jgi:hypothetical protein
VRRGREVNIEPAPNHVRIAMILLSSCSRPSPTTRMYVQVVTRQVAELSVCFTCWTQAGMQTGFLQRFPRWPLRTGLHRASRRPCGTKHRRSHYRRPRSYLRRGQSSEATIVGLAQTARNPHMGVDSCHGKQSSWGFGAHKKPRGQTCMQVVLHRCAWFWHPPWPGRRGGGQ